MDIRTTIRRRKPPRLPYETVARDILGDDYELSLVICGDALARRMNATYRHKTYSPNVLSFPLDQHTGEIFLNIPKATREARLMKVQVKNRMAHLFIHGCLHLKGYDHGDVMDAYEHRMMKKYGFKM